MFLTTWAGVTVLLCYCVTSVLPENLVCADDHWYLGFFGTVFDLHHGVHPSTDILLLGVRLLNISKREKNVKFDKIDASKLILK